MIKPIITFILVSLFPLNALARDKNHEDPTKIATHLGLSYTDSVKFSGSVRLDDLRRLDASVNADGEEWRIGGSWLMRLGIMDFSFTQTEFDPGKRDSYNIRTFIPLRYFGIEPFSIQLFPMAGYSYNTGETDHFDDSNLERDYMLVPASSNGGYLGILGLQQIRKRWSVIGFGGASKGSDNYTGFWIGVGLSHQFSRSKFINIYGVMAEDDFGDNSRLGATFTYEFN
ncbi:hypothetical protein EK599_09945 [Vibrio sp. T187]|uniref:hypothetical protein n=1 Tax=Vibrio TaxID=662 RepID=UPI0010C9A9FA|nr:MULTISPECIES: hypothetical protein [Vibrio]MBW3696019.1 hypothetical protein [Vibrio sp. T187]